jgi:hypothetical protein
MPLDEEEEDDEEEAGESTDKAVLPEEPSFSVACAAARFFPRLRAFAAAAADIFQTVAVKDADRSIHLETAEIAGGRASAN